MWKETIGVTSKRAGQYDLPFKKKAFCWLYEGRMVKVPLGNLDTRVLHLVGREGKVTCFGVGALEIVRNYQTQNVF